MSTLEGRLRVSWFGSATRQDRLLDRRRWRQVICYGDSFLFQCCWSEKHVNEREMKQIQSVGRKVVLKSMQRLRCAAAFFLLMNCRFAPSCRPAEITHMFFWLCMMG